MPVGVQPTYWAQTNEYFMYYPIGKGCTLAITLADNYHMAKTAQLRDTLVPANQGHASPPVLPTQSATPQHRHVLPARKSTWFMVRHQRLLHKARQAVEDAVQEEANPHNDRVSVSDERFHDETSMPSIRPI